MSPDDTSLEAIALVVSPFGLRAVHRMRVVSASVEERRRRAKKVKG